MEQIKNKIDFEANMFIFILGLKEQKEKQYNAIDVAHNIAYIFHNREEFELYFFKYGIIDKALLELCIMKTTKKGSIISLKGLCDYTISKYLSKKEKRLLIKHNS